MVPSSRMRQAYGIGIVLNPLKVMVIWFPGSRLSVELTGAGTSLVPLPGFTGCVGVVSQPVVTNTIANSNPPQTLFIKQLIKSILTRPIAQNLPAHLILGLFILPTDIGLGQKLRLLLPIRCRVG